MDFIVSATTDIGLTKATNQDSHYVCVLNTPQGKMAFAAICDGMGGLAKGEVASASLITALRKWVHETLPIRAQNPLVDADIRADWVSIATTYNEKIKAYAGACGISMGTTVTVLLLTQSRYYIMNVGDTRAYEICDTVPVRVLTQDQTVIAQEIARGNLTEEEAENDPRRSILLQCVGASDDVVPDMFFGDVPEHAVYMLCSDGFRHEITPQELYETLHPNQMCEAQGMKAQLDALIALNKQRQERDNITAVAIRTF